MRILLVTQDDPFYLAENVDYLIRQLPSHSQVVACCLLKVSPFGQRESFIAKSLKTIKVFGARFFARYTLLYLANRIRPSKRLKSVLRRLQIPIVTPAGSINDAATLSICRSFKPDLFISIAGNQVFKRELISLAPEGCLNLHTALLPKYRGLLPTFWVLRNDEKETGVSVFFVDEAIDNGPILVQKKVRIDGQTQEELIRQTKGIGMIAILEAIEMIQSGHYELIENKAADGTYFSFPTRDDVRGFRRIGKRFF